MTARYDATGAEATEFAPDRPTDRTTGPATDTGAVTSQTPETGQTPETSQTPETVTLREATVMDAAELRRLTIGFDPEAASHPVEIFTKAFVDAVHSPDHLLIVAEATDSKGATHLRGYTLAHDQGGGLRREHSVGRIHDMYVEEQARGTGIGRAMMQVVERWAGGRPLPMILDWQASPGAVGFYEALGYEADREGDYATYPGFCLDLR